MVPRRIWPKRRPASAADPVGARQAACDRCRAGARIEIKPTARSDARLAFKRARLASARDAWVVARVADPSGESGRSIGHTFYARWRWWITPERARLEVGASVLRRGRFAREAPNATSGGDPTYAYAQLTVLF